MGENFVEVILTGTKTWIDGFVSGYLLGRMAKGHYWDAEKEGIECESLGEKLREACPFSHESRHYVLSEKLLPVFRELVEDSHCTKNHLSLVRGRDVKGLRFDFSALSHCKEAGGRIVKIFKGHDASLKFHWESELKETADPEAKGVELYAPDFEYELSGQGTVSGSVKSIMEFYKTCKNHSEIAVKNLRLQE